MNLVKFFSLVSLCNKIGFNFNDFWADCHIIEINGNATFDRKLWRIHNVIGWSDKGNGNQLINYFAAIVRGRKDFVSQLNPEVFCFRSIRTQNTENNKIVFLQNKCNSRRESSRNSEWFNSLWNTHVHDNHSTAAVWDSLCRYIQSCGIRTNNSNPDRLFSIVDATRDRLVWCRRRE